MSDPFKQLTSTDLLRLTQQTSGRRQRAMFAALRLQLLMENASNLDDTQRSTLRNVIDELGELFPEKKA